MLIFKLVSFKKKIRHFNSKWKLRNERKHKNKNYLDGMKIRIIVLFNKKESNKNELHTKAFSLERWINDHDWYFLVIQYSFIFINFILKVPTKCSVSREINYNLSDILLVVVIITLSSSFWPSLYPCNSNENQMEKSTQVARDEE